MAVTDLWVGRHGQPTKRHGRGLRWRAQVAGHPVSLWATKREAKAAETRMLTKGRPGPAGRATVDELVAVWLAGKAGLSPDGLKQCRYAAARVNTFWAGVPAAEVTRADAQAWIARMTVMAQAKKGQPAVLVPASHTTKSKTVQCLAGALEVAVEAGGIPANPARGLAIGRTVRREPRFLAPTELAILAEASTMPDAIWLLGTTGLRVSEGLRLAVGDVDQRRMRLRVLKSKSGKARDVPITKLLVDKLDLERAAAAPLLVHPSGRPQERKTFRNNVIVRAAKRAGLGSVTTHDLRHTAASLAIRSGADVKMVQLMMGHASATTTLDHYGHLWAGGLDDVAARLAGLFEDPQ